MIPPYRVQRDAAVNQNSANVIAKSSSREFPKALVLHIFPQNVKYFQQAYQLATKQLYGYLFIDLTPTCEDERRLRSGIFPDEKHYVHAPRP